MDPSLVTLETDGSLAVITLNRDKQRNALLPQTLEELIAACDQIQADNNVGVVLLKGAGRSFSVGFDLKSMAALMAGGMPDRAELEATARLGEDAVSALQNLDAITLGAAHGHAIGGGFLLFAACDIRVAATDTVFSVPELDLGLPLTWGGVPLLMRELGPSRARELIVTCRRFGPELLMPLGFLYQTYEAGRFEESVAALAQELCHKPNWALGDSKKQFRAACSESPVNDAELFANAVLHPEFLAIAMKYLSSLSNR
jgi:enoyl-CoA hydratase/carnithine racemase